jgi:Mrp family chromosome partitioning ATPase/capsular polysaccharide biosynthesis protein
VTDQPVQAAPNERWSTEADEPLVDRPGIVASLLQYRLIVVVATLLGAVAGFGVAQQMPVLYEAEASQILSDPGGPSFLGGDPLPSVDRGAYLAKQASIMTSSIVLRPVVDGLGDGQSVRGLRKRLKVQPSADMAGISIVATGPNSRSAASLANAVGIAYEKVASERASQAADRAIRSIEKVKARRQTELDASPRSPDGQVTPRQQQLADDIDGLEQREQDLRDKLALYGSGVELFEQAERPESPTQPKPKLTALLGAMLGLLGAGLWAWWAAARNQRATGRGVPARILGAPLLGEVPRLRASWASPGELATLPLEPSMADAYHIVVASLEHELADAGGSSVAVTSVGLGDTRTLTTLSIATAAWEEHRKVLLIDADERTRRLSELYGFHEVGAERNGDFLHPAPGERLNTDEYVRRLVYTGSAMVLPITRNGTDPDHLVSSYHVPDVRQVLSAIGQLFDLVLIDTPAVLAVSDALSVAGQADGIVLLVPHRVLLRDLRDARERLTFVKTPLIGYVYVRPSGPRILERWTLGRRRHELRRQQETRKRVADASGDAGGAQSEGPPVPSEQRSAP